MDSTIRARRTALAGLLGVATALALGSAAPAQDSSGDKPKREYIEAVAQGTSSQMGRMGRITFTIEEYSTDEERQALIDAFVKSGSKGLYNALSKMKSKGRVSLPGTLGYDINYAKQFQTPTGRKIRIVTDRPIRIGEAWSDSRSMDYNLSVAEIDLTDGDKGTGTLVPAAQFKLDSNKELSIEAFRNPWKLLEVSVRD